MSPDIVSSTQVALALIGLAVMALAIWCLHRWADPYGEREDKFEAVWPDPPPLLPEITKYPPMPMVKPPKTEPEVIKIVLSGSSRGVIIYKGK